MRLSIMALASAQSSPYVAGPTLTERRVSSPVGENHPTLRPGITPWPLFLSAVQQVEMVLHRAGIGTRRDRHARHAAAPGLKICENQKIEEPISKAVRCTREMAGVGCARSSCSAGGEKRRPVGVREGGEVGNTLHGWRPAEPSCDGWPGREAEWRFIREFGNWRKRNGGEFGNWSGGGIGVEEEFGWMGIGVVVEFGWTGIGVDGK